MTLKFACFLLFFCYSSHAFSENYFSEIKLISNQSTDSNRVNFLNRKSYDLINRKVDSSLFYAQQSLKLAMKIKYDHGKAEALYLIGKLNVINHDLADALTYFQRALRLFEKVENKPRKSDCYDEMGNIYLLKMYDLEALTYFTKSLAIAKQMRDDSKVASLNSKIGNICQMQRNFKQANEFHLQALKYYEKTKLNSEYMMVLNELSKNHAFENKFNESNEFVEKGLNRAIEAQNQLYTSIFLYQKSSNLFQQGFEKEALSNLLKILKINSNQISESLDVKTLKLISAIYFKQNKADSALISALKCYEMAQKIDDKKEMVEILDVLAKYYASKKEFKKAYEYASKTATLTDSVFINEDIKKMLQIQFNYELEKREQAIKILEKNKFETEIEVSNQRFLNTVLVVIVVLVTCLALLFIYGRYRQKKANKTLLETNNQIAHRNKEISRQKLEIEKQAESLTELNQLNNKIFSIISHDIRGPLQSLQGMLYLIDRDVLKKEEFVNIKTKIHQHLGVVVVMLNNILQWSKQQMNGLSEPQIEQLTLKTNVQSTINLLQSMADEKHISLYNLIDDDTILETDANYLDIILRNLISNALKFTPNGGKVSVEAIKENGNLLICVNDNGIGMTKEQQFKLFKPSTHFSSQGTNKESGTGLGLMLCRDMVEKCGGKIWVESGTGKGSSFCFTIGKS
jgi:two-component system, sensor histidine kinase and response regulator